MAEGQPGLAHEPGPPLIGAFQEKGGFVEQVEQRLSAGGFLRHPLHGVQVAVIRGEERERLPAVGGDRALFQDDGVGMKSLGRHGGYRLGSGPAAAGTTAPPEMIIFMPSPTVRSSSTISAGGSMTR